MVRRLIQKQNIRLAQKQLDKGNLCLLSTGKLGQRFLSLFLGKAELTDDYIILFFKIVSAVFLEFFFHCGITCHGLFGIISLKCLCRSFQFFFPALHRSKDFTHFLLKRNGRIFKRNLF